MTRWQATVEIVKSFNDNGKPGYALAALSMLVVATLGSMALVGAIGGKIAALIS